MAGAARRADGESSIYQDASGRWHGFVSMGRKDGGRRDRRHVSGTKRRDVVRRVRELERKRDAGQVTTAGRPPTLEAWLKHWLDTIASARVRPSTWEGYRSKIESRIVPALGHHRLDRLQPEHIEAFYAAAAADGMASASVLQCHRILSRALKIAVQRGRVARNVCALVDAPSLHREEVKPLAGEEARRILDAARDRRNSARWSVALALGLRQGEALGLLWDDVDLDAGTLTVRRALQRRRWRHGCADVDRCPAERAVKCPQRTSGGLVLDEPKSGAARRTIALPAQLVDALRSHRAAQLEERISAGELWDDHRLVFAQPTGLPIDPSADWKAWKALLRDAGVRDARLHDARHTAATLLLQQGVHPRVAMQVLGHSQIALTLGTYSHVVPELARDAADRMGAALWGEVATTVAPPRRPRSAS